MGLNYIFGFVLIASALFMVTICNYAWADTIVAVQSGNWNNILTWGGRVPSSTDDKVIPFGVTVTVSNDINNAGTITDNSIIVVKPEIVLNNTGTIKVTGVNGTILNSGIIKNYGTLINDANHLIVNNPQAIFNTFSHHTTTNYGTIENLGTVANYNFAELDNFGTINNNNALHNSGGNLSNSGSIYDICKATFTNSGRFTGNPIVNVPCISVTIFASPDGTVLPSTQVNLHANIVTQNGWNNLWSLSVPAGSKASLAGTVGDFTYFVPDVIGTYTITATATDGLGNKDSASITVAASNKTALFPGKDSYVIGDAPNINQGASQILKVHHLRQMRTLLSFDLAPFENTYITSAKLRVFAQLNGYNWGNGESVEIHKLTTNWTEGNGIDAYTGTGLGVTWNCATDSIVENTIANCNPQWNGGTFVPKPTDIKPITNKTVGVWLEFNVTNDVKSFLDGNTKNNFGWIIKKTNEQTSGDIAFASKESSPNQPQLVLTSLSQPIGLAATTITQTTFTAGWQSVTGATAYDITIVDLSDHSKIIKQKNITNTSAVIPDLTPGTQYYWDVTAKNSLVTSTTSSVVYTWTRSAPPTGITVQPTGPTTANVSWKASTGATYYHITLTPAGKIPLIIYVPATSYTLTNLTPGTNYSLTLSSGNPSGYSIQSTPVNFTTSLRYNGDIGMITFAFGHAFDSESLGIDNMTRYNFVGNISPVETKIGQPGWLNPTQLLAYKKDGWEILDHSMTHSRIDSTTSSAVLYYEIDHSKNLLTTMGFCITGYESPYDVITTKSAVHINNNYKYAVINPNKQNTVYSITHDGAQWNFPLAIHYSGVGKGLAIHDFATAKAAIDYAIINHTYLILNFHQIDSSTNPYSTYPSVFWQILQYVKQKSDAGQLKVESSVQALDISCP